MPFTTTGAGRGAGGLFFRPVLAYANLDCETQMSIADVSRGFAHSMGSFFAIKVGPSFVSPKPNALTALYLYLLENRQI